MKRIICMFFVLALLKGTIVTASCESAFVSGEAVFEGAKRDYSMYWMETTYDAETGTTYSRMCECDFETGEITYTDVSGYIVAGDVSGDGFYLVDNNKHDLSWQPEFWFHDCMPFNLYYYSKDGVSLVYENLSIDDLCGVLGYWDNVLWYVSSGLLYPEGVDLITGEKYTYLRKHREAGAEVAMNNDPKIYAMLPDGSLVRCLPDQYKLERIYLDGHREVLATSTEIRQGEFRSIYYHPNSDSVYFMQNTKISEPVMFEPNYRNTLYRYSLSTGEKILCRKSDGKALSLMDTYFATASPDGKDWFVLKYTAENVLLAMYSENADSIQFHYDLPRAISIDRPFGFINH